MVGDKVFLEDGEHTCLSKITYGNADYYMFSNEKIYKLEGQNNFVESDLEKQFFMNMISFDKPDVNGTKMYF